MIAGLLFTAYLLTLLAVALTVLGGIDRFVALKKDELALDQRVFNERMRRRQESEQERHRLFLAMWADVAPLLRAWLPWVVSPSDNADDSDDPIDVTPREVSL